MRECATSLQPEMSPAEHELLLSVLKESAHKGLHLEIGTAAGGTLCAMMQTVQEAPFVVVDPMTYFPQQQDIVVRNLREHQLDPNRVDFRVSTSRDAFKEATKKQDSFDFILIDGCHKIRSVIQDLKWLRRLNVGGTVCLHDFTPVHRGVFLAINRLLSGWSNYEILGQADSLLALRKRAPSTVPEITAADEWYATMMYLPLQVERKWSRFKRKFSASPRKSASIR